MSDILSCGSPTEWESWLTAHWQRPTGVWLKIAKKGSGVAGVTINEAYFLQWYSPRRPRSSWSKVNVARVEALVAAGRMRPPGLAAVEAAKADGRWEAAYESQRNATVPPDLAAALDHDDRAKAAFESLGDPSAMPSSCRCSTARRPPER